MMCTTVLHGGVCHRTSTPHKSGIKMKEKKKCVNVMLRLSKTYCSPGPRVCAVGPNEMYYW